MINGVRLRPSTSSAYWVGWAGRGAGVGTAWQGQLAGLGWAGCTAGLCGVHVAGGWLGGFAEKYQEQSFHPATLTRCCLLQEWNPGKVSASRQTRGEAASLLRPPTAAHSKPPTGTRKPQAIWGQAITSLPTMSHTLLADPRAGLHAALPVPCRRLTRAAASTSCWPAPAGSSCEFASREQGPRGLEAGGYAMHALACRKALLQNTSMPPAWLFAAALPYHCPAPALWQVELFCPCPCSPLRSQDLGVQFKPPQAADSADPAAAVPAPESESKGTQAPAGTGPAAAASPALEVVEQDG